VAAGGSCARSFRGSVTAGKSAAGPSRGELETMTVLAWLVAAMVGLATLALLYIGPRWYGAAPLVLTLSLAWAVERALDRRRPPAAGV